MRVNFKKIEIHNFLSFDDEVFNFIDFNGLNLVCGKNNDVPGSRNGAGKSAVFSAICFALFGETYNKIKNDNIKNRYSEDKEVRVVLYFDVENTEYKIISGINKYNNSYCNLYLIKDNEDIDLTKSSIAETHKFLENEILHFDMSIFLRTILLTSDNQYNFFRLKKNDKKEFIEKLFDISIFGDMFNLIHKDIISYDKQIISLQNQLIILNKNNSEYLEQIEKYNTSKQEEINKIKNDLDILNKKYEEIKSTELKNNDTEVKKYETLSDRVSEEIRKFESQIREIDSKIKTIDIGIHKLESTRTIKQNSIDKYSELLNKLCDDCKDIYREYYNINSTTEEIQKINLKVDKLNVSKNDLDVSRNNINNTLETYNDKFKKISNKIVELTSEANKVKSNLILLESKIENFNTNLSAANKALDNNPYKELLKNNEEKLKSETEALNEIKEKYKYLKFAENIVSQDTLKKFIIKDLIHLLNNKITFYLNKLGANYSCIFDENMSYVFKTMGGECEYDSFSSGERMRLNIASSFAFRDFMATRSNLVSNILILDEYIDSNIDSLAIDGIIEILKEYILIYNQNIFVISHRKEIDNSIFNNIIQIQKTNNISKIKVLSM